MNAFDKITELETSVRELKSELAATNGRMSDLCDDIMSACRSNK